MTLDPKLRLGLEDVKQMARELFKKQHYIVAGWPKMPLAEMAELKPGYRDTKLWQYNMGHVFEAVEYATVLDWNMQNALIHHIRPHWPRLVDGDSNGIFLKMRPLGAKR